MTDNAFTSALALMPDTVKIALADIKTREMMEEAIAFAYARSDARQMLEKFVTTSESRRGAEPSEAAAYSSNPTTPSDRLAKALTDPDSAAMITGLMEFATNARGRISLKQFIGRARYSLDIPFDSNLVLHDIKHTKDGYKVFGIDDQKTFVDLVSGELDRYPGKTTYHRLHPERLTDIQVKFFARIAGRLGELSAQETISLSDLIGGRLDYGIATEAHQGFQMMRAKAEENPELFKKDITALTPSDLDHISQIPKVGLRTFWEIVVFKRLVEQTDHFRNMALPHILGPAESRHQPSALSY